MGVKELGKLIGQQRLYGMGKGLDVYVEIVDVKVAYGSVRYEIKPLSGQGSTWVEGSSLKGMEVEESFLRRLVG